MSIARFMIYIKVMTSKKIEGIVSQRQFKYGKSARSLAPEGGSRIVRGLSPYCVTFQNLDKLLDFLEVCS